MTKALTLSFERWHWFVRGEVKEREHNAAVRQVDSQWRTVVAFEKATGDKAHESAERKQIVTKQQVYVRLVHVRLIVDSLLCYFYRPLKEVSWSGSGLLV